MQIKTTDGTDGYLLNGRIVCFDIGTSRIGVAVSDPLGYTAQGIGFFINEGLGSIVAKIGELEKNYGKFNRIVIGYPLNLDGREGAKAESIRLLSEELAKLVDTPVELCDERFSTKQAQWALKENKINTKKQKNVIDMLAAQVILQGYLDMHTL